MKSLFLFFSIVCIFTLFTSEALARGGCSACNGACAPVQRSEVTNLQVSVNVKPRLGSWWWSKPAPGPVDPTPIPAVVPVPACTPVAPACSDVDSLQAVEGPRKPLRTLGKAVLHKAAKVATLPVRVLRR